MTKEEFKKQLIDTKIFLERKDNVVSNVERFLEDCIKKYGPGDYRAVAFKVINYQIDKYKNELYSQDDLRKRIWFHEDKIRDIKV